MATDALVLTPDWIEPHHTVADVLRWFPQTGPVFDRFGFTLLRNPLLRWAILRRTTLAQAAAVGRVPLADLLTALRRASGLPEVSAPTATGCTGRCACCAYHHQTNGGAE